MRPLEVAARVWSKVDRGEGCWMWPGRPNSAGYGRITYRGEQLYVHRIAYEAVNGAIADGLTVDHLCRNQMCVNPNHMELVSRAENTRRAQAGRPEPSRTQCRRGHPLLGENLYTTPDGRGQCRACHRQRQAERT